MGNIEHIYDYAFGDFMNRQRTMGSPQTQTFMFDNVRAKLAYRLTSAQASGGANGVYATETYTYTASTGNLYSKAGGTYTYGDSNHAHAVTSLSNNNTYSYDANGNQVTRYVGGVNYSLTYDAENRLVKVTWSVSNKIEFTFDGDGNRVKSVLNTSTTTTFIGTYYEVTGSAITKYYYADTSRVAMRTSSGVRYIFGDHLGSTSITADGSGGNSIRQLYKAWGEVRYSSGSLPTKYAYTGQYSYASAGEIGLLFYVARYYDPVLGRYSSPDSIIPIESQGVQAWDRYAYVNNSPVVLLDPSGHDVGCPGANADQCQVGFTSRYIYGEMKRNSRGDISKTLVVLNTDNKTKLGAYLLWYSKVASGKDWDHKPIIKELESEVRRDIKYQQVGDYEYSRDTWSNIHYGYVGKASGFSTDELLDGAGLAQLKNKIEDKNVAYSWDFLVGNWRRFDYPSDQASIKLGIALWEEFRFGLTYEQFLRLLKDWPGLNKKPVDEEKSGTK